jgi:hypothetical protein
VQEEGKKEKRSEVTSALLPFCVGEGKPKARKKSSKTLKKLRKILFPFLQIVP